MVRSSYSYYGGVKMSALIIFNMINFYPTFSK